MTSVWKRIGLGLALIASASVTASAATQAPALAPAKATRPTPPAAPPSIRARINELGQGFDGRVGIAVRSIDEGWATGWKADELYPQQSVSKLWVSITAMDAVDRGKGSLDASATLTRDALTLFPQPIRELILGSGGYTTTLGDLME